MGGAAAASDGVKPLSLLSRGNIVIRTKIWLVDMGGHVVFGSNVGSDYRVFAIYQILLGWKQNEYSVLL